VRISFRMNRIRALTAGVGLLILGLLERNYWMPSRFATALRIWRIFEQNKRTAVRILFPLLERHRISGWKRRRYLRYARNAMALISVQPKLRKLGLASQKRTLRIGAFFGLCIPLFDDSFDSASRAGAREFSLHFGRTLDGCEWRFEEVPDAFGDDTGIFRAAVRALWEEIGADRQPSFVAHLREMNAAQLDGLVPKEQAADLGSLKSMASRKGEASFIMLLEALAPLDGGREAEVLRRCASWAQLADDYSDIEEDRDAEIPTYASTMEDDAQVLSELETDLETILLELRSIYGREAELFVCTLRLYLLVKTTKRRLEKLCRCWGLPYETMPASFRKSISSEYCSTL
jgi:hypothetical protein